MRNTAHGLRPTRSLLALFSRAGLLIGLFWVVAPALLSRPVPVAFHEAERVSPELLRQHVLYLSTLDPPRTYAERTLQDSARYIHQAFRRSCEEATEQVYAVEDSGRRYSNLLCRFGSPSADRLVVGAHYDVAGATPGADDNASGVAALLELARLLAVSPTKLSRRIDLVAFTLEEPPYFATEQMGSVVHARRLAQEKARVKLMVSLEMLGYYSDQPGSQRFPHGLFKLFYPSTGHFILLVGRLGEGDKVRAFRRHMQQGSTVAVHSLTGPEKLFGIDFSDHRSYWAQGYPALMVTDTAFYRNPHYHRTTDTPDTLDYARLAAVVQGIYYALLRF